MMSKESALVRVAIGGTILGTAAGKYKADKKWLGRRGITPRALRLGTRMTPEAFEKYVARPEREKFERLVREKK